LLPDMLEAGWGRIINISSSSAQTGAPGKGHYAASKGGVIGFTRALAMEYADKGITVNHVPPGLIDTPLTREGPYDVDAAAAMMPMKRAGQPEDVAYAVAYLASEEAGYVTGQTLSANGGRYLA
jgi:2-hydroxycyclohexanecarboxyl-CoA dehydrogenase